MTRSSLFCLALLGAASCRPSAPAAPKGVGVTTPTTTTDGGEGATPDAPPASSTSAATVGVVSFVKVVSNQVADVSSLAAWKRSFIAPTLSDAEKAQAVWRSVVAFRQQDTPAEEFLESSTHPHDPHFTGVQALSAFNAVGGSNYTASAKVPVENTGGTGTADAHWR